ncbi:LuxR C-terminal-related transcriptional regulator [Nocardioides taihuensis]|uniref:LuxR C-terminal-related transcriptional regulator n=1 Tax=Nocardioides taihuensis TaxID=1835606 RepID=UPI00367257EC
MSDRIERGTRGALTLVSAPAGYGKTLAVALWAEQRAADAPPLAVLTLREEHATPRVFWTSALEALRTAGIDLSGVTAPSGASDARVVQAVARAVARAETPTAWVIDCGEHDLADAVAAGLDRVLQASAGRLRLVLLTRTDPALPLHRYRLAGSITEVRAADLVLTATEAATFLAGTGLELTPSDVTTLRDRTGGWPAGLRFAAIALRERDDVSAALADFRGDTGNVAAYLMTEVLARQEPDVTRFLLRTCIVDEVTPPVAAALTGAPCDDGVLEDLARGTSFLERVPGRPGRFVYPSLLRQFLRSQLSWAEPELEVELHRAAAQWLARDGEPVAAVQHAVDADDWTLACELLVDRIGVGTLLVGERASTLRGLVAAVPTEASGPGPAVVRASLALSDHDLATCAAELQRARTGLAAQGAGPTSAMSLAVTAVAAVAGSLGDDADAALDLAMAADTELRLAAEEETQVPSDLVALVAGARARVLLLRGDVAAAGRALEDGVRAAEGARLTALHAELQGMAALVAAVAGRLRAAAQSTHRLLARSEDVGISRAATVALAWVRMDEYALSDVEHLVDASQAGGGGFDARLLSGVLALVRGRLDVARGDHELARAGLRAAAADAARLGPTNWLVRCLVAEQVLACLAEDCPEEAMALLADPSVAGPDLEPLRQRVQRAVSPGTPDLPAPSGRRLASWPLERQVAWLLLLADQASRRGERGVALDHVTTALRKAAGEQMRRPFLEAEGEVLALVAEAGAPATRWLRVPDPEQLGRADAVVADAGSDLLEPLTRKEREVLGHLAELLTTEEIAEAMFVSVNTVRSHVRSLLRKLGVTRRNEAVRRAWDLGLLPRRLSDPGALVPRAGEAH